MELANRVRELRARDKTTQEALADKVGVTRQTIISIEQGDYSPSVLLALKIAQALEVPLEKAFFIRSKDDKQTT
jgi:putative transcriptional regulator